jgi:hypothetical protein
MVWDHTANATRFFARTWIRWGICNLARAHPHTAHPVGKSLLCRHIVAPISTRESPAVAAVAASIWDHIANATRSFARTWIRWGICNLARAHPHTAHPVGKTLLCRHIVAPISTRESLAVAAVSASIRDHTANATRSFARTWIRWGICNLARAHPHTAHPVDKSHLCRHTVVPISIRVDSFTIHVEKVNRQGQFDNGIFLQNAKDAHTLCPGCQYSCWHRIATDRPT